MGKRICLLGCVFLLLSGCGREQELENPAFLDTTEESENLIVVGLAQVGSEYDCVTLFSRKWIILCLTPLWKPGGMQCLKRRRMRGFP